MDASTLAQKMLEWEKLQNQADALAAEIQAAVMEIGRTQGVGNVTASYSAGRGSFDYAGAGVTADPTIIQEFTKTVYQTDWKSVCEKAGIQAVFTPGAPNVKLKINKG